MKANLKLHRIEAVQAPFEKRWTIVAYYSNSGHQKHGEPHYAAQRSFEAPHRASVGKTIMSVEDEIEVEIVP